MKYENLPKCIKYEIHTNTTQLTKKKKSINWASKLFFSTLNS